MTTEITQVENLNQIQTGLQAFEERKEKVSALAEKTSLLELTDWKDKEALKLVSSFRKEIKSERVAIQKEGKAMRDLITPINKHILSKEKELVDILEPQEQRLQRLEDWAEAELEKEKQAAIEAENARIQTRIDALAELGYQIDYSDVKSMSDETFGKYLEGAKAQFEKEQAEKAEAERLRLEQEEKERQEREAEAKRMQEERSELERMRAEQEEIARKQKEEQDRIDAEKRRIEQEKAEAERLRLKEIEDKKRAEELEAAKAKAAEDARLKAIQDAKDAEAKRIEDERKKKEAEARKAARQPDKTKIENYISAIQLIAFPEVKTDEGKAALKQIASEIQSTLENAKKIYSAL